MGADPIALEGWDDAPVAVARFDADGALTACNQNWRTTTQVAAPTADGFAAVAESERTAVRDAWRTHVAESTEPLTLELPLVTPSGPRWFLMSASRSTDGTWLAVFTDVHAQHERARKLERERDAFEQIIDVMPQMAWTTDAEGKTLFRSRRWRAYTGTTGMDHVEGAALAAKLVHPDDREGAFRVWTGSFVSGEPFEYQARVKSMEDGRYHWFLSRAMPIRDEAGRLVRWIGTSTLIDNQKQAQERSAFLSQASAALAEVLDYASTLRTVAGLAVPAFADWCAVDLVDEDGALERVAVTHTDPAKVALAQRLQERYPPPRDAASGTMAVLRTGESELMKSIPDELLVEAANDEEHLALLRELGLRSYMCVPLLLRQRVFGVLTFVTAESGREYDEGDLELAEDLARRAQIAIDNALLYQELQNADRQKDEFLATLAHELRNPLAPLTLGLELMAQQRDAPELHERTRARLVRQVEQLVRLVDDLLDVSRISRGKLSLERAPVRIADVVNAAVETCAPATQRGGHEVVVELGDEDVVVIGDSARLTQVFANLLHNAAKYSPEAGEIRVEVTYDDREVTVAVRDTGIGIAAEMLDSIFDMFVQAEGSQHGRESGLGLGLTLVKRLVELHAGRIEVMSDGADQGSCFVVHLPRSTLADDAVFTETDAESAVPASLRILVVDDNVDAAEMLRALLESFGCEVFTAYGGKEAIDAAERHRPRLVFLDIGMPVVDGFEVARHIRSRPWSDDVTLAALTGWGQPQDRERTRAAGFDEHFVKPVDVDALRRFLSKIR